jgi:hypothetical protein
VNCANKWQERILLKKISRSGNKISLVRADLIKKPSSEGCKTISEV